MHSQKKYLALLLLIIVTMIWASNAPGTVVNGVRFEKEVNIDQINLPLRGAGVLRYMVFIKAYAGALYLPEEIAMGDVLTDVPKHLEVQYFHALKGKDFGPATIKSLKKNIDPETLERLMPRVAFHNSLYVDVKPGDRYALTYVPGQGTTLSLNGVAKGTIDGADFAAALFSIWLGPDPMDVKFKMALLGIK